jgi:hypothetical protein
LYSGFKPNEEYPQCTTHMGHLSAKERLRYTHCLSYFSVTTSFQRKWVLWSSIKESLAGSAVQNPLISAAEWRWTNSGPLFHLQGLQKLVCFYL